jgi:TonB family protein
VLRQLRGEEREAYGRARFADPGAVKAQVKADRGEGTSTDGALRARPTIMKTASGFRPDLVEDLMAASGCKVEGTPWAALEVTYDAGAKVERLAMPPMNDLSLACRRVARVLLLSSLVPGDRPPRPAETDLLMLPLFLSCPFEWNTSPVPPAHPDGPQIVGPQRVHGVPPVYPPAARALGRQGVVILEATVAPTGCVHAVEVLRGVALDLDAEALRAVMRWQYTPTLLNGVPVPVIMTVTVNFRLK